MRRSWEALASVLIVSAVAAGTAQARPVTHHNKQSRDEVVRYWTAERMKNAKPVERVVGQSPKAKPGGGPAGGTATEVPLPYPSAEGKVFFTDSGVNYVCSGSAILSTNESVVWTAGHCVNEGPGAYYTNFMFVPAYRDGAAPYGKFVAPTLLTTSGWRGSGEFGVDLGAAVVGTNESGQSLTDAVAEVPLVFDSARNQSYALYGYPAAGKFNGQRMYVCNTAWSRNDTSATPATMGVPCDMTGGSSGGGWVTAAGSVASVVSYGYSNLKNVLFGPHQETEAQQLYSAAQAPTNLVSDPGFEAGTSGFNGYQATVTRTTSEHHSGSSALQIVTQANQPFANGHMSAAAPGGVGVTLDIWVKAPPGYNHTVYVNSWDAGFRWLSSPIWQVATGNGTWQHFTASGTLHADTAYLEYGVGDPGSGQPQATLYVDDAGLWLQG